VIRDDTLESPALYDLVLDRLRLEHGVLGDFVDSGESRHDIRSPSALLHAALVEGQSLA
jgi:hypothetical protein